MLRPALELPVLSAQGLLPFTVEIIVNNWINRAEIIGVKESSDAVNVMIEPATFSFWPP